jgi:endo-1,4-beta-mannosidase
MAMNQPMLPDEEMEDNYLDFIIDEALTEDEEDMLTSKLEQDEQLSMLFDKVLEVASEFAGSGPVEGPGSGVSDSIPARLSDGEFVFTAKATEEIGASELMRMMKDAEARADERQQMQTGGPMEEETMTMQNNEPVTQEIRVVKETVDSTGRMMEDEDEISKNIKSQMMLDPNQRHVRS